MSQTSSGHRGRSGIILSVPEHISWRTVSVKQQKARLAAETDSPTVYRRIKLCSATLSEIRSGRHSNLENQLGCVKMWNCQNLTAAVVPNDTKIALKVKGQHVLTKIKCHHNVFTRQRRIQKLLVEDDGCPSPPKTGHLFMLDGQLCR